LRSTTRPRASLSQETDGVTIGEEQISQIQHKHVAGGLCVDDVAQLVQIASVKLTADSEHDRSGPSPVNSQHRSGCSERNCQTS
jgi:hypothetical protein